MLLCSVISIKMLVLTANISASSRVRYCMLLVVSTWSSWPLMVGEYPEGRERKRERINGRDRESEGTTNFQNTRHKLYLNNAICIFAFGYKLRLADSTINSS